MAEQSLKLVIGHQLSTLFYLEKVALNPSTHGDHNFTVIVFVSDNH